MTPEQALAILDQATQPGVRLTRNDCILIQQALGVLTEVIKKESEKGLSNGGRSKESFKKNSS